MADPLHALRHAAMDLIETFIDNRIEQMQGYINGENNLHNLQNAINQLNMINNAIIDPALVAGDVAVEVLNAEELEEARDIARQSINETRNRIPGFINYINGENNMHNLQHAINNLNFINNQITNPALFAPPGN